jgi:hypothetical protein
LCPVDHRPPRASKDILRLSAGKVHAVGTSALLGDEIRRVCAAASISRRGCIKC